MAVISGALYSSAQSTSRENDKLDDDIAVAYVAPTSRVLLTEEQDWPEQNQSGARWEAGQSGTGQCMQSKTGTVLRALC